MKGAIIGDIIGSTYEFFPIRDNDFPLFGDTYYFTDDTVLTIATAEKLLNNSNYDDVYVKWSRKNPHVGWGTHYAVWFKSEDRLPYNSFGNGSAMRVSPIGWHFDTLEETLEEAKKSAEITHNHPEGIKGAQAVATAIFLARTNHTKEEIKKYIEDTFGYNLSRTYDEIHKGYSFDVTCQGSVPEAIICFLEFDDFETIIRNTIALGGDADTQAAIAGSIAEAFYGSVPKDIWNECEKVLDSDMLQVLNNFVKSCKHYK